MNIPWKIFVFTVFCFFCVSIFLPPVMADEATSPKLKFSFSERLRYESWDNTVSLSEEPNAGPSTAYTRHRTTIGAQWFPNENLEFAIKLTNEFRYYLTPKERDFKIHEIFFDQLYIKWKNIAQLPLTLTLGRQNMIMGEGFVIIEPNPLDGSRAIGFNAIRLDYNFDKNHSLTAFYCYQPETDNLLPLINSQDQAMIEQPERGLGLYYVGNFNKTRLDVYYIRKDIDDTDTKPFDAGINALGARLNLPITTKLSLTVETTFELGKFADIDQKGFGGYFHLDYQFGDQVPILNTLTLGGIFYTGDNPETEKIEAWEPLFGRWPKWSESLIYSFIKEKAIAYWTNLNSIYISCLLDLMQSMKLRLTYHHLGAGQVGMSAFTSGNGKSRGDLFMGRIDFEINKHTSGHFVWEHFNPGSYYFDGADVANWLRFELFFTF